MARTKRRRPELQRKAVNVWIQNSKKTLGIELMKRLIPIPEYLPITFYENL